MAMSDDEHAVVEAGEKTDLFAGYSITTNSSGVYLKIDAPAQGQTAVSEIAIIEQLNKRDITEFNRNDGNIR